MATKKVYYGDVQLATTDDLKAYVASTIATLNLEPLKYLKAGTNGVATITTDTYGCSMQCPIPGTGSTGVMPLLTLHSSYITAKAPEVSIAAYSELYGTSELLLRSHGTEGMAQLTARDNIRSSTYTLALGTTVANGENKPDTNIEFKRDEGIILSKTHTRHSNDVERTVLGLTNDGLLVDMEDTLTLQPAYTAFYTGRKRGSTAYVTIDRHTDTNANGVLDLFRNEMETYKDSKGTYVYPCIKTKESTDKILISNNRTTGSGYGMPRMLIGWNERSATDVRVLLGAGTMDANGVVVNGKLDLDTGWFGDASVMSGEKLAALNASISTTNNMISLLEMSNRAIIRTQDQENGVVGIILDNYPISSDISQGVTLFSYASIGSTTTNVRTLSLRDEGAFVETGSLSIPQQQQDSWGYLRTVDSCSFCTGQNLGSYTFPLSGTTAAAGLVAKSALEEFIQVGGSGGSGGRGIQYIEMSPGAIISGYGSVTISAMHVILASDTQSTTRSGMIELLTNGTIRQTVHNSDSTPGNTISGMIELSVAANSSGLKMETSRGDITLTAGAGKVNLQPANGVYTTSDVYIP